MKDTSWRDLPAGSRERYEAAKKDPSVSVTGFMNGDYRITSLRKKKQGGTGAPFFGDKGSPYKRGERYPKADQRDMGPNPPKNPKSEALRRMRAGKNK